MRIVTGVFFCAMLSTAAPSQGSRPAKAEVSPELAALAQQLRNPRQRASAMHDLVQAKGEGAQAVWRAFAAAAANKDGTAEMFAKALARLGSASSDVLEPMVTQLSKHPEPLRSHLLRAVSNGALFANHQQRELIRREAKQWAAAGHLYSPAADQPTFAWYEYVRLVRRLALAERGHSADAITQAMAALRRQRGSAPVFGAAPAKGKHPHCAIESFGAHGQRETLEGIAELAARCADVSDAVLEEMTSYLTYSPPRSPRLRTEHCAGIGENAPNALPGKDWPTKWLYDEWHFACAETVLLRSSVPADRTLALRHLLHASNATTRQRAIERVRQWPKPHIGFAPDLKQCLAADDRTIVRAAVLTIGQDKQLVAALKNELTRIVAGTDRELKVMAQQALRTSN